MWRQRNSRPRDEAELDITPFLNLMIVLVPVLLMMMVFTRVTVLPLQLPAPSLADANVDNPESEPPPTLTLVVQPQGAALFYPADQLVKQIPAHDGQDWAQVQATLKQVKQALQRQNIEKRDIVLMLDDRLTYQQLVDAVQISRSYKDVLVTSVVDAELFPEFSFADMQPAYQQLVWPAEPQS